MNPRKRRRLLTIAITIGAVFVGATNGFPELFEHSAVVPVSPWFVAPFVTLLLAIALAPFIDKHWWENNYPAVTFVLASIVIGYYILTLDNGSRLLHTSREYVSFISLIGSLFVVAGGIHIEVRGRATPWENAGILTFGAILSNILGTTGASMLLIRPYLRMNRHRFRPYHVVFFIFIVSNIGGALTPIGDPPLFLGYLKGVPFFWVAAKAAVIWAFTLGVVLAVFLAYEFTSLRRKGLEKDHIAARPDQTRITGLHNVFFLGVILAAVFIERPAMVREVLMWGAAIGSLFTTEKSIYENNEFTFGPVKEVAILFVGIFFTMLPALDWLALNAQSIGISTVGQYYWATGVLSSVLDNAPTYLNFLSASFGLHGASVDDPVHMTMMLGLSEPNAAILHIAPGIQAVSATSWLYVLAISVAAVFFGACTYIGNGPNFMVKSIAETAGVTVPSFAGYVVRYSLPILVPVYAVVWFIFFRM